MSTTLVRTAIIAGIVIVFGKLIVWPHVGRESEMGFVSNQWVAEHRLAQTSESER